MEVGTIQGCNDASLETQNDWFNVQLRKVFWMVQVHLAGG